MKIITYPNKILETPTEKIKNFDEKLAKLIFEMRSAMKKNKGVGLAAPQIGEKISLIVVECEKDAEASRPHIPFTVIINPKIISTSKETEIDVEGCLSLPNIWGDVERSKKIEVEYFDENGKKIKRKCSGFLARVFQHEIDHLNGIVFTQRIKDVSTLHTIDESGKRRPIIKI